MVFDAAGTIQQKYLPILGSDELARKLAYRHTFHEKRTPENLEMEFKSMLVDLGWERKLGLLADMFLRAEGKERGFVLDALREGLGKCVVNGYLIAPAGLLEKDLPPEFITEVEDAMAEGASKARGKGNLALGEAAALLGRASTPWRVVGIICKECEGTRYFTRIADAFPREGMPTGSHIIAMDAMVNSIKKIEKAVRADLRGIEGTGPGGEGVEERKKRAREPMAPVICLLQKRKLPGSIHLRAIQACRGCGLHRMGFVKRLGELFSRPDVEGKAKAEAGRTLLGGEMEACVAAGYRNQVSGITDANGVPEEIKERAGEILGGRQVKKGRGGGRQAQAAPCITDTGFMDARFAGYRERKAITPAEAAPTIRVELKRAGKKG